MRAQSMVEFAVVLPAFLLLLFALIDFGRLVFTYVSLSNGAREMARTAAISQSWNNGAAAASNASIAAFNNSTHSKIQRAVGYLATLNAARGHSKQTRAVRSDPQNAVTAFMET